jgi:hypothetical protein
LSISISERTIKSGGAMKILATTAIVAALSATNASAQFNPFLPYYNYPLYVPPPGSAFGADPVMRVTTPFRTAIVVTEEAARRTLYGMAEGECAVLSEVFQAECRLSSFTITTPVPTPTATPPPASSMVAPAIYELKPLKSK